MQGFTRRDLFETALAASVGAMATEEEPAWACSTETSEAVSPAQISVVARKKEDIVLQFAAQDLMRYLRQMTGEPIAEGIGGAAHHIFLGEIPATADKGKKQHAF